MITQSLGFCAAGPLLMWAISHGLPWALWCVLDQLPKAPLFGFDVLVCLFCWGLDGVHIGLLPGGVTFDERGPNPDL